MLQYKETESQLHDKTLQLKLNLSFIKWRSLSCLWNVQNTQHYLGVCWIFQLRNNILLRSSLTKVRMPLYGLDSTCLKYFMECRENYRRLDSIFAFFSNKDTYIGPLSHDLSRYSIFVFLFSGILAIAHLQRTALSKHRKITKFVGWSLLEVGKVETCNLFINF